MIKPNSASTGQDFWIRRFTERVNQLKLQYHDDPDRFYIEVAKVHMAMASSDKEREQIKGILKTFKLLAK